MAGMTRIDRIRDKVKLLNLECQIQAGMPGYVITIFTKCGQGQFCGNSAEALAYLNGYGNALTVTDTKSLHYDAGNLPVWYTK